MKTCAFVFVFALSLPSGPPTTLLSGWSIDDEHKSRSLTAILPPEIFALVRRKGQNWLEIFTSDVILTAPLPDCRRDLTWPKKTPSHLTRLLKTIDAENRDRGARF